MSIRQYARISYRWAILAATVMGVFWGVWYVVFGEVPISIGGIADASRWWDIPAAAFFGWYGATVRFFFERHESQKGGTAMQLLSFGMILVGASGLLAGLPMGLHGGLIVSIVLLTVLVMAGLFIWLIVWPVRWMVNTKLFHLTIEYFWEYFWEGQ